MPRTIKTNRPTIRYGSRIGQQQLRLRREAEYMVGAVDKILASFAYRLRTTKPSNFQQVFDLANRLQPALMAEIAKRLKRIAVWNYRQSGRELVTVLPQAKLQAAVAEDWTTLQQSVLDLLFPPMSYQDVLDIVFRSVNGMAWHDRLAASTRLASPTVLSTIISQGLSSGKTHQEIYQDLLPVMNNVRASARRVARTETIRVGHETQWSAWEVMGDSVIGYTVHATKDEHTRPWHLKRDGTQYWKSPGPGQKGMLQMPRPPLEAEDASERPARTPQVAFNCLLPDNVVQGTFDTASKSWYSGKAIELESRNGFRFAVTANHPVFTKRGIVPAEKVTELDYLFCYGREDGRSICGGHNIQQAPTKISQVFESAKKLWPSGIKPGTTFDFYGDETRGDSDIEIVTSNRVLLESLVCRDEVENFGFMFADKSSTFKVEHSPFLHRFDSICHSSPGYKSFGGLQFSGLDSFASVFRCLSFGPASELDASIKQYPVEASSGLIRIFGMSTAYSEFVSELFDRNPGVVTLDKVSKVRDFDYTGHVYDLQSEKGWIVANSIFISNCRCYLTPILR